MFCNLCMIGRSFRLVSLVRCCISRDRIHSVDCPTYIHSGRFSSLVCNHIAYIPDLSFGISFICARLYGWRLFSSWYCRANGDGFSDLLMFI